MEAESVPKMVCLGLVMMKMASIGIDGTFPVASAREFGRNHVEVKIGW